MTVRASAGALHRVRAINPTIVWVRGAEIDKAVGCGESRAERGWSVAPAGRHVLIDVFSNDLTRLSAITGAPHSLRKAPGTHVAL